MSASSSHISMQTDWRRSEAVTWRCIIWMEKQPKSAVGCSAICRGQKLVTVAVDKKLLTPINAESYTRIHDQHV